MVITSKVSSQYFDDNEQSLIRIAQDDPNPNAQTKRSGTPWTAEEHNRFLQALEMYPSGPWKLVAAYVGTRTTRQTMTHGQKYREKIARHKRSTEQFEAMRRLHAGNMGEHSDTDASSDPKLREDSLFPYGEVDEFYDATLTSLLEAYEPLDLSAEDDDLLLGIASTSAL